MLWPSAKVGIAADQLAESVCGAGLIVVLAEDEAELNARVGVFGIEADGVVKLFDSVVQMASLSQGEAEIVVSFGEIGVGHGGFAEFFERAIGILLAPIEQSKAGMDLRVVGLKLQALFRRQLGLLLRRLYARR